MLRIVVVRVQGEHVLASLVHALPDAQVNRLFGLVQKEVNSSLYAFTGHVDLLSV